jgi:hypothetical protein
LGREQDNVPELSDMSILGLLFQCAGAKKWIQISVLV